MMALEALRKAERRDALALMIDDPAAKRILVAWTYLKPPYVDFGVPDAMQMDEVRDIAWGRIRANYKLLGRMANVPYRLVREKFDTLRLAGLVYPDGTASDLALRVIGNEVAASVSRAAGAS